MSEQEDAGVALVAGVGPGLGASLCRALSASGYEVGALARTIEASEALCRQIEQEGGRATAVSCDVCEQREVDAAAAEVASALGPVSVLVYNAGVLVRGGFETLDPEAFERAWRVSCLGAVHCAQAVLPGMLERGSGAILVTGATASVRGSANFSAFAASKFALRGLTQSLARELGPKGIHVAHVVVDGVIWSERARGWGMSEEQCMAPDAIAVEYVHLLEQDRSTWSHEIDLRPFGEKF